MLADNVFAQVTAAVLLCAVGAYPQSTPTGDKVRKLYEAGESAMQQGDLAAAEKDFLAVLASFPMMLERG